jgi:hypothetical protein
MAHEYFPIERVAEAFPGIEQPDILLLGQVMSIFKVA